MNIYFLITTFYIAFKSIKNKIITLFSILFLSICLCLISISFVEDFLENSDFKLDIAIVNLDKNTTTNKVINFFLSTSEIDDRFRVEFLNSASEGEKYVFENKAIACVVLPEDFLNGILYGYNYPAEVIIKDTNTIEKILLETTAKSLEAILVDAQSSIYSTIYYLKQNNDFDDSYILPINIEFISTLLSILNDIDDDGLQYTKTLPLSTDYFLSISIYILLLSTALFYKDLHIESNKLLFKQISTLRDDFKYIYFSRLLCLIFIYFIIILSIVLFLNGSLNFIGIISITISSIFLVLIQTLIFNIFKEYISTVQISFVINTFFLFISGGIIPELFLPKFFTTISYISPITLIKQLLANTIIYTDIILVKTIIILFISSIIFIYLSKSSQRISKIDTIRN